MAKQEKTNKVSEFLERHRKKAIVFNVVIWTLVIMFGIMISKDDTRISNEEMQDIVDSECDNLVILPVDVQYSVKFTDTELGTTQCEVIIE